MTPDLRGRALETTAVELGLRPTSELPDVWAVLMETGYPKGAATLACFAEGTSSLYFHPGGGIIGAGRHASVRTAAEAFLRSAQQANAELSPVNQTPLPTAGEVRFYVRTFDGMRGAEATDRELGAGRHRLSALFLAGQSVITAIRIETERQKAEQART